MRFLLILLSLLITSSPFVFAQTKPNIIVIMADDLGYGDLSCYGATALHTPNIDRLAAEGQRFTRGYSSASTCTPTRYSFLTGTYAFREKGKGIAAPNSPLIIPAHTFTLPDLLKRAGYQTAVIGKWHLGLGDKNGPDWNGLLKPGPREIGFDYNFLLPTTNDRVPQVYVENQRVLNLDPKDPLWVGMKKPSPDHPTGKSHRDSLKMNWSHGHNGTIHNGISRIGFYTGGHAARFRDEDLGDKWVEKSIQWIEANQKDPFFLFFASHDLHVPRMPHERFQGKTALGFRGDAIIELDWAVGELMNTLDRLQLAENTLVIFCSDNGPVMDDGYQDYALAKVGDHRASGRYSGGKYSVYEGGTRTPFITRWKGEIQPGISDKLVCTIDLFASFAELTQTPIPTNACRDSFNLLPALLGQDKAQGRKSLIQQDNGNAGNFGYLSGKWKLQRHDKKRTRNLQVAKALSNTPVPKFQLYDLTDDPEEKKNIIKQHPDIAERLKTELATLIKTGTSH
ncbi:MAG: arylsulfatase [Verrucomicrobiales bacterium]|nr:arylsulfatase [Verrucomicrobiales bacterium]